MELYTIEEIKKVPCFRCGGMGNQHWNICADDENVNRVICVECDIELNKMVLIFMGFDNVDNLIENYKKKLGVL